MRGEQRTGRPAPPGSRLLSKRPGVHAGPRHTHTHTRTRTALTWSGPSLPAPRRGPLLTVPWPASQRAVLDPGSLSEACLLYKM